jgi:2'-hydroxyisoflavone reductase
MTTRRDLLKLASLPAAAALPWAASVAVPAKAARPPRIMILGGTAFTGPLQVADALARGHEGTLFNRDRRHSPEWPGKVEQPLGDRDIGDLRSLEGREWDVRIDHPTSLPSWVPRAGTPFSGCGAADNARAIAAVLTIRPPSATVADLLAWYRTLPEARRAEVLAAWKASRTG